MAVITGSIRPAYDQRTNPQWERIEDLIHARQVEYTPATSSIRANRGHGGDMRALAAQYSAFISHPDTVAEVVKMVGPKVMAALVGNGYWASLLIERGLDVISYDHRTVFGPRPSILVHRLDSSCSEIRAHDDRTLFMVEPVKLSRAATVLKEYNGDRVVWLGQFPPTPGKLNEAMSAWNPVKKFRPVFWLPHHFEVVQLERPTPERMSEWTTQLLPQLLTPPEGYLPSFS